MAFSIPLVLCIDAEPDEFVPHPGRAEPWSGFEATTPLVQEWRQRFEETTQSSVAFSWFVRSDPQVEHIYGSAGWPFERYGACLGNAAAAGDEIGLHVHPSRWSAAEDCWVEDFASEPWIEECVSRGYEAYASSLGARCRSVRLGNHWMSQETSDILERLDLEYDLTVEPGARARDHLGPSHVVRGMLPDYANLPRTPYRRSRWSYRHADDDREDGLWMLPVSTVQIDAASPASVRDVSDDGAYLRLGLWYPREAFRYVFEACLCELNPPCLVLVMRSDMPLVPSMLSAIRGNIDWILAHPLRRRFHVSRPDQAVAMVQAHEARITHVDLVPSATARGERAPASARG
jgi:hypothetical protein